MKKILLAFLLLLTLISPIFSQNKITIQDIWKDNAFAEEAPDGFTPLKDGEHYVQMITANDESEKFLVKYEYLSGRAVDTLLKSSQLIPEGEGAAINPSNFQLSDDESKILFYINRERIYRHSFLADYYVYNLITKKLVAVSKNGKQQSAVISPDGSKVAFVRDNNLFIAFLQDGIETQITEDGKKNFIINGVCDWVYEEEFSFTTAFQWSPDSKHIAYYRFDETEVPEYTIQFFRELYPENYTYKYPKVGEKNSVASILIYHLDSRNITQVGTGNETNQYIPRIKWTDDPNQLCVFRMNRWQNKLELLLADATSGNTSLMFTEENKRYIEINDFLTFFNHNKNFIWVSEQNGWMHIYNYTTKGTLVNEITKGNYDVTNMYGLDEKRGVIYYQSAEVSPLQRYVYSIKLDGTGKKQITIGEGWNEVGFNPTFSYYMVTHSDANTPSNYVLFNAIGKQLRVLEDNKDLREKLSQLELSKKEFFAFRTSDSVSLNGFMIKPASFNPSNQYPVFMTFYGGPGSQQVTDSWSGTNYMLHQFFAQHGYIVVCVDNRGTGARGEEFRKMTYLQLGKYETIDQIETAKYLGTLPFVDKSRIGTFGWSYGGYLSSLCIEKGNDVFKAAVAVAPVTDWRFYDSIYTERYMRDNEENQKGYEDNSPIYFTDMIKGNFLLIHGLSDDNVHYQNTAAFMKKLYENDVHFDQMTFPDKNHSITGGSTRYYLFTAITDWIFENL